MPFFLIIIAESFFFWFLSQQFGFWQTMGIYWLPTLFALIFLPTALRGIKRLKYQMNSDPGKVARQALKRLLIFLGLILFVLPFWSIRILALFIQTPGLAGWLLGRIKKKGNSQFFYAGPLGNHFQFYYSHYQKTQEGSEDKPSLKDVTPNQSLPLTKTSKSD